jgi:anhydro-N-acetylmuramic acid kinase
VKSLDKVRSKNPRLVVGLMSGTSCDGVNVAFVDIQRAGEAVRAKLRAFSESAFPDDLRRTLLSLAEVKTSRIDTLCAANFALARHYVECVRAACQEHRIPLDAIDLIGSHGQTVHHLPEAGATLQIGEPSVLAEALYVPVVADFRPKDMAAGGQGAPLVPYVDFLLLRDAKAGRAAQNLGGIGNVTYLPPACSAEQVIAFDTGPGNMVIDGVVQRLTQGQMRYDRDGKLALAGRSDDELVASMLQDPFFRRPPPKSTGRERFGAAFVGNLIAQGRARGLGPEDIVATATALTVESIALAYKMFLSPAGPIDEIILSGGGALNPTLVAWLRRRFGSRSRVASSDQYGIPLAAKEAMCFAVLADETVEGRPNNLPSATGASRPVVLGKIVLPE